MPEWGPENPGSGETGSRPFPPFSLSLRAIHGLSVRHRQKNRRGRPRPVSGAGYWKVTLPALQADDNAILIGKDVETRRHIIHRDIRIRANNAGCVWHNFWWNIQSILAEMWL